MFAFVKNVFDLRNDAKGYCSNIRRPQWKQCEDIGSWLQAGLRRKGFKGVFNPLGGLARPP